MANKKYLDLDSLKEYHLKLKPVIESKANSSEVYNKTDVYTKSEVDSALDSKSDVGHTHDQYITEQNVYTKEQIDSALESKSDISHTHDQYLTDIGIDILFDGSDTLKGTATDYKILGVDSTKTYYLSGTKFIGIGCTNITITPIVATSATCTYDEETGIVSWTIYGESSSGPVSANLSWTGAPGILTSTKDGIKTTVGYFNTINGESVVSKTGTKDFDIYTKSDINSALSAKADASNVYDKSEINTKLNAKANVSDVYTATTIDAKLNLKADSSNVYNKSEINTKLNAKANVSDVYTTSQVDTKLSSKADISNVYNKSEINTKLNAKANSSDVYTRTQMDTALNGKSDISHEHNSEYVSNVVMKPSSSGSQWVSGIPGDFSTDFGDGPVYPVSGTINIGLGLDEKNITFTPGEGAKRATGSYNSSTGDYSWTLYGIAGNTKANGHITWTSGDNQLKVTKDGTTRTIGYFNTINGESVINATESKNFSFYTNAEIDNKLSKKANVSDVYTTSQVDTKLSEKANASDVYTATTIDAKLNLKANSSDVYTRTQMDTALNLKANASDVYTKEQVDNGLSYRLPIVGTASSGETKAYNRYAQKGYSGGSSTYWYYKIATLPAYNSSGNYASLIITGRIGGWEASNMSSINALVFNRGEEGIVAIDLAKTSSRAAYNLCDIVCYREEHGETSVYLKCAGYFTFDISIEAYQHDIILPTSVSKLTSVTGTEQVKLSTTKSRLEVYNGNAYIGGTRLVKSNESLKNPNSLTFGSQTYDGSAAKTITASDLSAYTKTEVDTSLNAKANASDVYSKSDVDTKLSGKADKATTLSGYGITNAYTKTETNNLINSKTKTVAFDTYNKFIEFLEDTSQATYDYFNVGDSIYIKEEGSDYWISGKEDIVEDGYAYRYISGTTGSDLLGTDNIFRKIVTENIGTTYTSVTVDGIEPSDGSCNYSNFSWNSSTGVVKITLESLQPNKNVTVRLKCHVSASGGGDYGYYYISNIGPDISGKADKATTLSGYGITNAYTKTEVDTKLNAKANVSDVYSKSDVDTKLSGKANKATTLSGYGITNAYTKTEVDNKLSGKSNVGHSHKSIIDYGDTTNTIKIGYRGNGLTASQIAYIAGYSVDDPNNPNEHKIKDISKDVLKSWLGYTEVSSGIISPGGTLTATSGYVWIIFPHDTSATTFTFSYGSGNRTGYGFAIVQGGGCIRYFQSATQLTRYSISTITFSNLMVYIKFKI